jgi:hypothetical protein
MNISVDKMVGLVSRYNKYTICTIQYLPTTGFQHGALHLQRRHAEVRYPDVVLIIQQQILRLQVSMAATYTTYTTCTTIHISSIKH